MKAGVRCLPAKIADRPLRVKDVQRPEPGAPASLCACLPAAFAERIFTLWKAKSLR